MINTGVASDLNVPQTFHTFSYQYASGTLVSLAMRVALVGMKSAAGTATVNQVYEVADSNQSDGLFGVGSELALMCRMAMSCSSFFQRGPRVYAVCIAEPGASAARTTTATVTGTATADGNLIFKVAGRTFTVGVRSGAVQNTIASSINSALQAAAQVLPVSSAVATNVATMTHRTAGVNGNDLKTEVVQSVPGVTLAFAQGVAGTGVSVISTAVDALATLPYDGIAIGNHAAADITTINADIQARWAPGDKGWRYYFLGEPGTIGTGTTLAAAANHQAVLIGSYENCPNTAGEIATFMAMAVFSRERPNAIYNNLRGPLFPSSAADAYTKTEQETAIAAGLTPITPVISSTGAIIEGQSKIIRMVTTKTTENSQPFAILRDIGVSRTGIYYAKQLDIAFEDRFGASAQPDGVYLTDDTIDQVGDMQAAIARQMGAANIIRNVEADLAKSKRERSSTLGRLDAELFYTVVLGLHQIAWRHNVLV